MLLLVFPYLVLPHTHTLTHSHIFHSTHTLSIPSSMLCVLHTTYLYTQYSLHLSVCLPNSCPLSRWCHPAISSSVAPLSCWPQSFTASGSFPMSQFFAWGGQSIGVSASASVLPMNTQDWSSLGWTGWTSLQSRVSQESFPTPWFKSINFLALSFFHSSTLTSIHDHWENESLD